jgi:hypothetical protein
MSGLPPTPIDIPSPPADATLFAFPPGLSGTMFFGSLFFGGIGIALTLMFISDPSTFSFCFMVLGIIVMLPMSILAYRTGQRCRDSVAVSSTGVWYLPRKDRPTYMPWSEVATVRAEDTWQRLLLLDCTGAKRIRLEYQLQNFGQLRDFVSHHVTPVSETYPSGEATFHRTLINKAILALFSMTTLSLGLISYRQGQSPTIFIAGAVCLLLVVMFDPNRVVVGPSSIVIFYPCWKREVRFDDVKSVDLTDIRSRGNVWAAVVIGRRRGKPIRLFRFREGSLALHQAVTSAWASFDKSNSRQQMPAQG